MSIIKPRDWTVVVSFDSTVSMSLKDSVCVNLQYTRRDAECLLLVYIPSWNFEDSQKAHIPRRERGVWLWLDVSVDALLGLQSQAPLARRVW